MKNKIYFITGNEGKAKYLADFLGFPVKCQKVDLEEIQSMNLKKIVQKKVREAYGLVKKPVLVEDVSLEFESLGNLPGPFIKFFVDNMELQGICDLVKGKNRKAKAKCCFGYFDGKTEEYFMSSLSGKIATKPRGKGGYGWDKIFEPDGYDGRTRAELSRGEDKETYLKIKPLGEIKNFLLK